MKWNQYDCLSLQSQSTVQQIIENPTGGHLTDDKVSRHVGTFSGLPSKCPNSLRYPTTNSYADVLEMLRLGQEADTGQEENEELRNENHHGENSRRVM